MAILPFRRKQSSTKITEAQRQPSESSSSSNAEATPARRQSITPWRKRSTRPENQRSNSEFSDQQQTSRQSSISGLAFLKKRKLLVVGVGWADQNDCAFITRLPYELREAIYLLIVEDEGWSIPVREVPESPVEQKKLRKARKKGRAVGGKSSAFSSLINLMVTCRAVHEETSKILHQKAEIHIPTLLTFQHFFHAKVQRATDMRRTIRHLTLTALFPYLLFNEREGGPKEDPNDPSNIIHFNSNVWALTCISLRYLSELRFLMIEMVARDYRDMHPAWPDRPSRRLQRFLLDPLRNIDWVDRFRVCVSWPLDGESDGYPFELRRLGQAERDIEVVEEPEEQNTVDAALATPVALWPPVVAAPALIVAPAPAPVGPAFRPSIPTYYGM